MSFSSALATNWIIVNLDTEEILEGDFEAQDTSRNVSTSYVEHSTLGRQHPITQFLHGNVDTLSFTGRFFMDPAILSITGLPFAGPIPLLPIQGPSNRFQLRPAQKIAKLVQWAKVDPDLQRPPIVLFSVGDGELQQGSVIESVSDIRYDRPLITGEVRGVTFTVNLREFVPFDIDAASKPAPQSRFHHVKAGEYHELVAYHEYNTPMLGDVVRKRYPDKQILKENDVLKLPSLEAIQSTAVTPSSIPLKTLDGNVPTVQRTLRQIVIDRLNITRFSTIVPEGV